jgi:hypothetical protein
MHNGMTFNNQAKVKETRLSKNDLAQPLYSIQHIEWYDLLCYKDNNQELHPSIIETEDKQYCNIGRAARQECE